MVGEPVPVAVRCSLPRRTTSDLVPNPRRSQRFAIASARTEASTQPVAPTPRPKPRRYLRLRTPARRHSRRVGDLVGARWVPWRALRDEHPDVVLTDLPAPLGRAVLIEDGDVRISPSTGPCPPADRLCPGSRAGPPGARRLRPRLRPATPLQVAVAREERRVDEIATRRLVPPDDLASWATARAELGEQVERWEVAEEPGVDDQTARRAIALCADELGRTA